MTHRSTLIVSSLPAAVPTQSNVGADVDVHAGKVPASMPEVEDDGTERKWPPLSIVMPVRNEEKYLAESVAEVLAQDYRGHIELILALGPSRDGTDQIAGELAAADPRIRLVRNPTGRTPAGLNAALRLASHDVIARVDGHGVLSPGYLSRAVEVLERTGAANVGGLMVAVGRTGFEQAVARAYGSRVGLGGGSFHVGGPEGPADTVYLGVFRRDVLERLGGFDEYYHRAQDWELNLRIRQSGEVVWFTPELSVTYHPRSSLGDLARQFFRTGQWRREVIRRNPGTVSQRYLAPPVATLVIGSGVLSGVAGATPGWGYLRWGWMAPLGYLAGVLVATLIEGRDMSWRARGWFPVVLSTIHLSWGSGFILGSLRPWRTRR